MDENQIKAAFDQVRAIFVGNLDIKGTEESPDSNSTKLIIMVPSFHVNKLAALIEQVERSVVQV